jgi:dihydroxy-acid dehydratase
MSGTAYGTCVLHVSPESFAGGPLALVKDGDQISLNAEARSIDLLVSAAELAARREKWQKPEPKFGRGYGALYAERVTQAHLGCDFDFLETVSSKSALEVASVSRETPEPEMH